MNKPIFLSPWNGGVPPVKNPDTFVCTIYRDGTINTDNDYCKPHYWQWDPEQPECDIIAFAILTPEKELVH